MTGLPTLLLKELKQTLFDCGPFGSDIALRAVFADDRIDLWKNKIPGVITPQERVEQFVSVFLDLENRLGQNGLALFLHVLYDRTEQRDSCCQRLKDVMIKVDAALGCNFAPQSAPQPVTSPPLALNHHFICYAPRDGAAHAQRLHAALTEAGLRPWLDLRDTPSGYDPEAAREGALRDCAAVLLVLTPSAADVQSDCVGEWRRALRYKKPVFPLRIVPGVDAPLALGRRPVLDFTGALAPAVDDLRRALDDLTTPAGQLRELEYRLADAERELRGASRDQRMRVEQDIAQLEKEIQAQRIVANNPQAAARAAEKRTEAALERERKPERPVAGRATTKFINPPPLIAPSYFQDRHVENRLIGDFLRDPARRVLTVVGRAGVGKTAMVCRLLKALESGHLPDDLGALPVSGIVYLSAVGSRRVSFPNLFEDLLKLLPTGERAPLEALYKDPQKSVAAKLHPVLSAFAQTVTTPVVLLLDNFEDLLDPATHAFADAEVDAALRALLDAPPHPVKVLLTTRIAPRDLLVLHPELQMTVPLDKGLPSPHAEEVLRAGDPTGVLELKNASDEYLASACEYTRGYPRALEALTAALNADRATTLEELLAGDPPENVVEALVGQAYSRLDPLAQKVMQGLAVFGRPVPPAAVDYLLQPTLSGIDSAPVLNRLVNARFVAKEAGRYYMHPVDRAYALQRLPAGSPEDRPSPPLSDLDRLFQPLPAKSRGVAPSDDSPPYSLLPTSYSLLRRAADYFRETRAPRAEWKTLADLAPHLAEIDLRCAAGDYDAAARVLTGIDFDYLLLWGHYRLMIDQHERLQGKLSDATLKRISVGNLGMAYESIAEIPNAIACYEKAFASAQEAKNKQAEGAWLGNLGNCYYHMGQTRRAIEVYEQALAIAYEIGDRGTEGIVLGNLGACYVSLGQTRRAIEFYEQALQIAKEIGDRRGEGIRLGNLGGRYADLGQTRRAIEFYEQALVIAREIGDRGGEGRHLGNLGICYADLGQTRRAIEFYEQALAIAREIGDRRNEGAYLSNLGNRYADLGQIRRAIEVYEQALAIAREIGDRRGEGAVLSNLGSRYGELGDYQRALEYYELALGNAREIGNRYGEAKRLRGMVEILIDQQLLNEALLHLQESIKIGAELSSPEVNSETHYSLALAYLCADDLPSARAAAEEARRYDYLTNNANVLALLGVIAAQQGDAEAAHECFAAARAHAEELLALTPENYNALDAQALALAGLGDVEAARVAYQAARVINSDAGIVQRATRLLAQLPGIEPFWEPADPADPE
jgi:tetratricopeptide (TPR) repeat protein